MSHLKRLHEACMVQPSLERLVRYVECGGDVDRVGKRHTLLGVCSRAGTLPEVRWLLEQGADIDKCDVAGSSATYIAASNGNIDILKLLIRCGADLDKKNHRGYTALLSALTNSHVECAQLLLKAGANVNLPSVGPPEQANISLLCRCIVFANTSQCYFSVVDKTTTHSLIQALLEAGVLPNESDSEILGLALSDLPDPIRLLKMFLYAGHKLDMKDSLFLGVWGYDSESERGKVLSEMRHILHEHRRNALSLQRLTRVAIRTSLAQSNVRLHLSNKIKQLPLPTHLHKYLNLEIL